MKKILLFTLGSFSLLIGNAQSVGIGTTTPSNLTKLHIVTTDSIALKIDGNNTKTGIQVSSGAVNIGPYQPISRLFVANHPESTDEVDAIAPIIGIATTANAALYGGVYGSFNGEVGVGIHGVGAGVDYANFFGDQYFDAGVYGSGTIGTLGLGVFGVNGIGGIYGIWGEIEDLTQQVPDTQYAVYGSSLGGSAATKFAGFFEGDVHVTGELSKGSGTFKIDDPIDPENKYLYHSFVESPDMMNIYNGNITTDANGIAEVTMPAYFDALNKDFRYQLTSIGTFAQAIVKKELDGNHFTVQTSQPNVKVSWQVTGVRKDKFAEAHRVKEEVEKEPWNKGFYLHAKEFGLDKTKSIANRQQAQVSTNSKMVAPRVLPSQLKLKINQSRFTKQAPLLRFNLNSN